MNNVLLISLAYLGGISLLLVLNEANYRWLHLKGEHSRKLAHVLATLTTVPFPWLFDSHGYVLVLALLFFGLLFITQRGRQLNSIHDINRHSYGSFLLPVAIYLTFLIYTFIGDPIMYVLPIVILAVCDPVAALIGKSFKKYNRSITLPGQKSRKTLAGSVAFWLSAFVISAIILNCFEKKEITSWILVSGIIALVGTLAELLSWRGSDNLSIPLCVQLVLIFML